MNTTESAKTVAARYAAEKALAGFDIDTNAALCAQAKESARLLKEQGWGRPNEDGCPVPESGAEYSIGFYFGDREAAEERLGRSMTDEETKALENAIRAWLDA